MEYTIARNKYHDAMTKRMNFNCPVAETSESIELNDNNLELNAIAYTFCKIDSNLYFNNSFGDRELLASVSLVFSPRRTRKLKKKTFFSVVEDSTLLRWHSGTQKRVGKAKQRDQIDNEARHFWKSIVKTKHQSLNSITLIRLVPGADRVVRHICIRVCCLQKRTLLIIRTFVAMLIMFYTVIRFSSCKGLHDSVVSVHHFAISIFLVSFFIMVVIQVFVCNYPGRDVMSIRVGQRCHIRDSHF